MEMALDALHKDPIFSAEHLKRPVRITEALKGAMIDEPDTLCLPVLIKYRRKTDCAAPRDDKRGYASSEWPPHITLAAYEDLDAEALCDWNGEFVRRAHAPKADVRLCEPSAAVCHAPRNRRAVPEPGARKAFCRFLLCVPRKIRVVLQRHRQLLRRFGGQAVIHCTLSVVRITELQDALELVFQNDVFTQAEVTALEIYTYPMRLIKRFDLTRA